MRILTVLLTTLLLWACALSPQTITVAPALDIAPETFGQGHSINIQVTDNRAQTAIGSRGGIYEKSSQIEPANDIVDAIRSEAAAGFARQGFSLTGTEADSLVTINIEQLSYVVPPGAIATSADITAALKVTVQRTVQRTAQRGDAKQHETVYRSTVNRRFPVVPTATQNEIWINEVLTETLQRLFVDPQIRALLVP